MQKLMIAALAACGLFLSACSAEMREAKVNEKDGLKYVWVPAGKFQMGCSETDVDCAPASQHGKMTTLTKGFYLTESEIPQAAFEKIMGRNPSVRKGPDLPVSYVVWEDADAYCKAVGGRLPWEAEWEWAARGGKTEERYGELDQIAWYSHTSGNLAHPVKQKQPNAYGLYDMLGNALEWTGGAMIALSLFPDTDPQNLQEEFHPVRGGGWWDAPNLVRASYRIHQDLIDIDINFGFRCAMD
jgi:formylglycine-generating enzyme required for sulfatase activity